MDMVERVELSDDELIAECARRWANKGGLQLSTEIFVGGLRYNPGTYWLRMIEPAAHKDPLW